MAESEPLRFADVLTMASSVASYLGAGDVSARHMLEGIAVLRGERQMQDLGPMRSPLLRPAPATQGGVEREVRALVQRWFARLGGDADAGLSPAQVEQLRDELKALHDAAHEKR